MDSYSIKQVSVQRLMSCVSSKVSFTTEIWTSPAQVPFMAVTAHYIDDDWVLQSILRDFVCIPGSHTGERICHAFRDVIETKYNFGDRIMGVTLDNASNNTTFMERLIESNPFFNETNHFRCFVHVVYLAVQSMLSVKSDQIAILREAIKGILPQPVKTPSNDPHHPASPTPGGHLTRENTHPLYGPTPYTGRRAEFYSLAAPGTSPHTKLSSVGTSLQC